MAFPQKIIGMDMAAGVGGDKATLNPCVYTDRNYIVAPGETVTAGTFVFEDENGFASANYKGSGDDAAARKLLGFVQRDIAYAGHGMEIPEGGALNIAIRGDFYAYFSGTGTPSVGMIVSADQGKPGGGINGATVSAWETKDAATEDAAGNTVLGTTLVKTGFVIRDIVDTADASGEFGPLCVISAW